MLLRSDDFVTFMLGTPPPSIQLFTNKQQQKTSSVIAMFRCLFESWGLNSNPHTMCMDIIYTQSQNIAHFATFPFWPFPKFTPPAHALFKKSYQVYYGMIGNYPSFKMIPNTTYIVLILKKYNRSKSNKFAYFVCWEYNISLKKKLCQYCVLQWSWDYAGEKILGSNFMQMKNTG